MDTAKDLLKKTQFVRTLKEGETIRSPFLIKYASLQTGKTGKPYLNLVFCDRTGDLEARVFEEVASLAGQAIKDVYAWVEGRCQLYQGRKQLVVNRMQILREDQVSPQDYIPETELNVHALYEKLLAQIASMQDPHYRKLCEAILKEDEEIKDRLMRAPAAKSIHHAYRGGLLEHMVSVVGVLERLTEHYAKWVDRDLVLVGGFLHDLCKIWELSYDKTTDYTDVGRFVGHLVMGVELVNEKVRLLDEQVPSSYPIPFPKEKLWLVKHVLLAHHGKLEFGSPKEAQCIEAVLVHMADDLDSKMQMIAHFVQNDATPGKWTALHRATERYFYKSALLQLQESPQAE